MNFSTNQIKQIESLGYSVRFPKYFELLDKFKVLPVFSFIENCDQHQVTVYRTLKYLEEKKVIRKMNIPFSSKPNAKLVFYDENYASKRSIKYDEQNFHHDYVTNLFMLELSKIPSFHNMVLEHEIYKGANLELTKQGDVEPDSVIYFSKPNGDGFYKIAIETEITRKSALRVIGKITKYVHSEHFNNVIYIFVNKEVYEAYKMIINEITDEKVKEGINRKITFLFNPNYLELSKNLKDSIVYKNGEEKKFDYIMEGLSYVTKQ